MTLVRVYELRFELLLVLDLCVCECIVSSIVLLYLIPLSLCVLCCIIDLAFLIASAGL